VNRRPIVADVTYEAGEIVAQCGLTVDVYAAKARDVTIGGRHVQWDRLVAMFITEDGLAQMRLALVAGDRLRIHHDTSSLQRYRSGAFGAMVTSDHGPWVRFEDVQALLNLGVKTGEQP
jgi:hypothetical protein